MLASYASSLSARQVRATCLDWPSPSYRACCPPCSIFRSPSEAPSLKPLFTTARRLPPPSLPCGPWPLPAALIPNLVYASISCIRTRAGSYSTQSPQDASLSLLMGLLWIGAVLIYGLSTRYLGQAGRFGGLGNLSDRDGAHSEHCRHRNGRMEVCVPPFLSCAGLRRADTGSSHCYYSRFYPIASW